MIDLGLDLFVFQRVENRMVKVGNACVDKGFQCSVFSNLIEFNTLNGIIPATTLKIDSRNWTPYQGMEKYKKERAGKRLERKREMGKKVSVDDGSDIKMGFLNISLASSLFCPC